MAFNEVYRKRAEFMVRSLPYITEEECFALKGGTAINFGSFTWSSKPVSHAIYLHDYGFNKVNRVMEPNPDQDYNPIRNTQQLNLQQKAEIANMEMELNQPVMLEEIDVAERHARMSIMKKVNSEQFHRFIETTRAQDGEHWPVAILTHERAREMEFRNKAGVIRLTSQSVNNEGGSHRARWHKWRDYEWEILQKLIDEGQWLMLEDNPHHREVWGDPEVNGKWWKAVIKQTSKDELMLVTFRRMRKRDLKRQEMKLQRPGTKGQ